MPPPVIGWVDFPYPNFLSVLHSGSSFVFNNDVILAILPGTNGGQVFFTSGETPATGSIPDPSPYVGGTPPSYADNLPLGSVVDLPATRYYDMTIKAIGTKNDGSPNSLVVQARIQFITANPIITGNNAAQFTITNQTVGAQMWYTIDGTDPTNAAPSLGPIYSGATLSLNIITNTMFKIRAFRTGYQPSGVVSALFSATNFVANSISFGFASGEASSDFVASPGQTFYAPVTLSLLSGVEMYSLQFNLTATNLTGPAISPGAISFESMLVKPIPGVTPIVYETIPPAMFVSTAVVPNPIWLDGSTNFSSLLFIDSTNNLMGVGWLERAGKTNLYDTTKQDLITFSMAHDTMFLSSAGRVVAGGFSFTVPATATNDQTYQIQIGRPSATSDGIGAPGSDVYIAAPTNGPISALKTVTVSQRKYTVGDAAPFRWFNAGDFGNSNLLNDDVMQVFQSAIYSLNYPPYDKKSWNGIGYTNVSDFFDAMDACGNRGELDTENGYYTNATYYATPGNLFDGNDTDINQIMFGDGQLDVCDVYVTFRRSLDPSLCWFNRFWANGQRVAESLCSPPPVARPLSLSPAASAASVKFAGADFVASAGQTLQVPITAQIQGDYPVRVLMLNLSVTPLDGSPALTSAIQFAPNPALGTPTLTDSKGNGNYAATWLNSSSPGVSSNATLGLLTVQVPANAASSAAYAVRFEHASASPNGLGSFPKKTQTGLITLSDRSASSWGDGISDAWRLRYFGSINNVLSAATADADGDGADNLHECKSGTDPNDAASVLRLRLSRGQAQDFVIRWPSGANKQYVVEWSPDFTVPSWTAISTNTGTGADIEFHDNSNGPAMRFYRVRVQP